ncbi:MAG TPA: cyclophane-forming radical SAM/SPASM peptide maturase GrrM/OscB [Ramlibacter sp.]|uniref:cyclophane-forming radical SAM/SPASM peptide maturase GrrM/OscB n=1 Tax=Ramlibacter sp. TaxID=1917967 RepID=UPI002B6A431A|nr:cyclophane-forming radical SAM/SPASM peptide maturase GrrM/OscB [Ramlibacter sp.]HVZ47007.1 cyclophane-forming radical SAM/SPASM peptide maturase GrrM/OscB [Ramlibacter sp.]
MLIIQGTPFCNLDCRYCYLPERSVKEFAPLGLFDRTAEKLHSEGLVGDALSILFHAGEPLVYPASGYAHCIAVFQSRFPATKLRFVVQTNGTLITDAWCEFFLKHGIEVGISIDGPARLHDAHRVTRTGKGTHSATLRGLRLLQKHGIAAHALAVLTRESLDDPCGLYDYFRSLGVASVSLNLEEIDGCNSASTLFAHATEAVVDRFFETYFESVKAAGPQAPFSREFENTLRNIFSKPGGQADESTPFRILTVDRTGQYYTFSPELAGTKAARYPDGFALGDIFDDAASIRGAATRHADLFDEVSAGVDACRTGCEYYGVCGGAFTSNRLAEHGTFAVRETKQCRLTVQAQTKAMLAVLKKAAATAAAGMAPAS